MSDPNFSKNPAQAIWDMLRDAGCPEWLRLILIIPLTLALFAVAAIVSVGLFYAALRMLAAIFF